MTLDRCRRRRRQYRLPAAVEDCSATTAQRVDLDGRRVADHVGGGLIAGCWQRRAPAPEVPSRR
jgi:hypothetical protein